MIARWEKGRTEIDALLAEHRVDRVSASRDLADLLLEQAETHLASALKL